MNRLILITHFFILSILYAECSDLTYEECIYWSGYCEWNEESDQCQDAGGGAGDDIEYGPYLFEYLTEADGISESS